MIEAKIIDGAVTIRKNHSGTNKLGAGSVALAKLASDSVNSDKIVDGSIATADIRSKSSIRFCPTILTKFL